MGGSKQQSTRPCCAPRVVTESLSTGYKLRYFRLFMVGTSSYKLSYFRKWRLLDGQELEASFVDASTGSDVEDPCEEEDKGGEHRQDVEANPRARRGKRRSVSDYHSILGPDNFAPTSIKAIWSTQSSAMCGAFSLFRIDEAKRPGADSCKETHPPGGRASSVHSVDGFLTRKRVSSHRSRDSPGE